MNWKVIVKNKLHQPAGTDYSAWKEQIAEECYHQCVYCSIHESPWGGIDHYHIDHYKPKSKFKELELDICNLFYACPVCNRFKSDDWPNEPVDKLDLPFYPDPSKIDYSLIFTVKEETSLLVADSVAARYVIERLYLNRPQLIYERREHLLTSKMTVLTASVNELLTRVDDSEIYKEAYEITGRLLKLLTEKQSIRPYKIDEIKKP